MTKPRDQRADYHPTRPSSGPDDGDLDLGASARRRQQPITPLAARCPGGGVPGRPPHLAGGRIPLVPVAFPRQGIALGDVSPVGALLVHAEVAMVDVRPDGLPAISDI